MYATFSPAKPGQSIHASNAPAHKSFNPRCVVVAVVSSPLNVSVVVNAFVLDDMFLAFARHHTPAAAATPQERSVVVVVVLLFSRATKPPRKPPPPEVVGTKARGISVVVMQKVP